ncbi:MAG: membrane protein insertion efficiency factor YidD [Gemmatimonadota bacterium]|nr:membrane protein insertion efficiency factor YidD [Gemmatimonadota bacterium]
MLTTVMTGAIRFYQQSLGALKPPCCRYHPTCSEYARLAIEAHGPAKGLWLGIRRIGRCHPLGGLGYDPVPDRPAAPTRKPPLPTRSNGGASP